MADFSNIEKINGTWKHLFGLLGTHNGAPPNGKMWFEETLAASHVVSEEDIWASEVPNANTYSEAKSNVGVVVEDRTDDISVTLVEDGTDWLISVAPFEPKVGYQITDQHPSPNYVKSIIAIEDLGGNTYRVTLNNNLGVSDGPAVLHRRIYLTPDPTTNNVAWFARETYGNHFSNLQRNFILPQKFGRGYFIRLFQSNGVEVLTTQGAWIFNYQKGMLLFGQGFTPTDLGYATPLYIELFRYTGEVGIGTSLPEGNMHDMLYYNGTEYVPTSNIQSDGVDLYVNNKLTVSGNFSLESDSAPITTSDPGELGEFRWDNNFLYIRTSTGWARTSIQRF